MTDAIFGKCGLCRDSAGAGCAARSTPYARHVEGTLLWSEPRNNRIRYAPRLRRLRMECTMAPDPPRGWNMYGAAVREVIK